MPHQFDFPQGDALVVITVQGVYTSAMLTEMLDALAADARYVPGMAILSDFRQAHFELSGNEIWGMLVLREAAIRRHGHHRSAVVVSGPMMYGLSRMVQSILSSTQLPTIFEVFSDRSEAEAWIAEDTQAREVG